ncbi:MAG TPA: PVC-type heme-binding CxxCH protein [Planctomycetota bacterium]|nr:PVC-type heme-binding CxxCH protein [Planctomycetota bacterium]
MMACLLLLAASQAAPLAPEESARRLNLPEGFRATVFAAEPDLVQPIAFALDDRGRVWAVESRSYPDWLPPGTEGRDRILIFEDRDGDGRFDSRRVFHDRLANVSGLALGFGGVWLCATPYLLFIPDRDADDRPDGPPEILLDGWNLKGRHNVASKPSWGPDGWLYGGHGILSTSLVGPPGAPDGARTAINCGVWRYHPVRRRFEAVAHGTTNPWGLDWDEAGELFITNCVIQHLWHVVPGAHYERMYGQDVTAPNLYALMPAASDHLHWAGGRWQDARGQERHLEHGGGHAHAGALIYLEDTWPARYRGTLFTVNLHGRRVQNDLLEPRGSTYRGRHGPDFLRAEDPWFRGLDLQAGPDGNVFLSDWNDTGECHDYDRAETETGRLFKISYGPSRRVEVDLARAADADLVARLAGRAEWFARRARRILQERAAEGRLEAGTIRALEARFRAETSAPRKLRVLWALHATGGLSEALLAEALAVPEEDVRAWALRLAADLGPPPESLRPLLLERAERDPSPRVRRALVEVLRRLPPRERFPIAERLAVRAEDAEDPHLPLLLWYALEPAAAADPARAAELLSRTRWPLLRRFLARRLASY